MPILIIDSHLGRDEALPALASREKRPQEPDEIQDPENLAREKECRLACFGKGLELLPLLLDIPVRRHSLGEQLEPSPEMDGRQLLARPHQVEDIFQPHEDLYESALLSRALEEVLSRGDAPAVGPPAMDIHVLVRVVEHHLQAQDHLPEILAEIPRLADAGVLQLYPIF